MQHDTHRIERVKVLKSEAENFYDSKGNKGEYLVEELVLVYHSLSSLLVLSLHNFIYGNA